MKIPNNVEKFKTVSSDDFLEMDFNMLKDANRDVSYLVNAIKKDGWNFPVFVWEESNYVIDGTGRRKALLELLDEGYTVPKIPVVYIKADNLEEAKKKTLQASSRFGIITNESYDIFIQDLDLDFDTFKVSVEGIDLLEEDEPDKEEVDLDLNPEFQVIVYCDSLTEQEETFNKINQQGYLCKTLNL